MSKILKGIKVLASGYVIAAAGLFSYGLGTALLQPNEPDPTGAAKAQLVVQVGTPGMVAEVCGGKGVLGCTWAAQDQCILVLPAIPEQGRSPYLATTGYEVLTTLAVWGHELAHCVGVDIHGEGK